MDIIFDALVEIIFEVFVDGFIALFSAFVPKNALAKKRKKIIRCICLAISVVLLVGLFIGVIVLLETNGQSFWGWLLIALTIIYLIAGVILKIVFHITHKK